MGDRRKQALRVQFDGKIKLRFRGSKITSDAGLLAFRELDEALPLTEPGSTLLSDCRQGMNTPHTVLAMLRQGVYGRLAGYEDVHDAHRLRVDPAMCRVVGGRAKEKEAASTREMSGEILEQGRRDISGRDARWCVYGVTIANGSRHIKMQILTYLVRRESDLFNVMCTTRKSDFDAKRDVFEKICQSLTLD